MSWVRFDDGFADHPKIARVGAFGAWLQMQALCYANKNLTDGFVPFGVARSFARRGVDYVDGTGAVWTLCETSGRQGRDLAEVDWPTVMVDAGIWEAADGGYQIHDYDDYQPSRKQVERERRAARGRMRFIRSSGDVRANFRKTSPEVPGTGTGSRDLFPSPESGVRRARVARRGPQPLPDEFALTDALAAELRANGCRNPALAFKAFRLKYEGLRDDRKRGWATNWTNKANQWALHHRQYGCPCQGADGAVALTAEEEQRLAHDVRDLLSR